MSKIIASIVLLALISYSACKNFWDCDTKGKFSCLKTQTCCTSVISSTGWACFPLSNGTCCSDGMSICPNTTNCNIRQRTCDKKNRTLTFLEETEFSVSASQFSEPKLGAYIEAKNFTWGFIEGSIFFNNMTHQEECLSKAQDAKIADQLGDIIYLISTLNIHSKFTESIIQIVTDSINIYTEIGIAITSCQAWEADASAVITKLANHINATGYIQKVSQHSMLNAGPIMDKAERGVNYFKTHNFYASGNSVGDILNFILFWDLQ